MPLYINTGQAADFFAKLRLELPKDSKDFFARDEMLLNVEQLLRMGFRWWAADGEYGKTCSLTEREKAKYLSMFQQICPGVNMDDVRLVDFCWYTKSAAPDYYDETDDSFYDEV